MANIPLVALQGGRTSGAYPPEYATPMGQLGQAVQIQHGLIENRRAQQTLQAQQRAGEVMATSSPENMFSNLAQSGVLGFVPEVGNMVTNRDNALSEINQRSTIQSTNASQAWIKTASAYAMTDNPTEEGFESIRRQFADNIADPNGRANFLRYSQDAGEALFGGLPSADAMAADPSLAARAREQLKNRAMGQIAGAVGTWDALSQFGLGGPMTTSDQGVTTYRPLSGPPGTIQQVDIQQTPLAGIPAQQPSPLGAAPPAAAPAAAPAAPVAPNALQPTSPLPPADQYQPGQVQASPLAPLPMPAPAASPAAQAPAPTAAPVTTSPGAAVASGQGGPPPRNMPAGWEQGSPWAAAPAAQAPPPAAAPPAGGGPAAPAAAAAPTRASGPGVSQYQQTPQGVPIAISDGKPLYAPGSLRGGSPAPPAHTSMGAPLWQQYQKQVDDAGKKFDEVSAQEDASQKLLAQATQVRDAFNTLRQGGGLTAPGTGLPARVDAIRSWNQMMDLMGRPESKVREEAAYTELQKVQTQMGFTALRQFFGVSREAMQTVQTSLNAVPGGSNTFVGGQLVNRMIEAFAQRSSDQYRYENQYMLENYGSAINADIKFAQEHPITDMVNGVLKEFGMTATGFNGATRAETANNLRTATRAGYITPQQAQDLWEGKAARAMQ